MHQVINYRMPRKRILLKSQRRHFRWKHVSPTWPVDRWTAAPAKLRIKALCAALRRRRRASSTTVRLAELLLTNPMLGFAWVCSFLGSCCCLFGCSIYALFVASCPNVPGVLTSCMFTVRSPMRSLVVVGRLSNFQNKGRLHGKKESFACLQF